MRALVIGADEKIGFELVKELNEEGYDVVATGKNKLKINKIKTDISEDIETIITNVTSTYNVKKLYNQIIKDDIDLVIDCLPSKKKGNFLASSIDDDLEFIDSNISSTHTIIKLFLTYFEKQNKGSILVISSNKEESATNITSESYILKLINSIKYELEKKQKKVYIGYYSNLSAKQIISKQNLI